jgi:hypothetical protein
MMTEGIGRTMRAVLTAAVLAGGAGAAVARGSLVGNWYVTVEEDRFGDGGTALAVTQSRSGDAMFAVRCIRRKWSLALMAGKVNPGEVFLIRMRVDRGDIADAAAAAISDAVVQIETDAATVSKIAGGRELALRIVDPRGTSRDYVFGLAKAKAALSRHIKECTLE